MKDPHQCIAVSPTSGNQCQRVVGHAQHAPQHWGPEREDTWGHLITIDLSSWPGAGSSAWLNEAKILEVQRPDARAAAALCREVAEAIDLMAQNTAP